MADSMTGNQIEGNDKSPSAFLCLPAEIRNHILELAGCLKILQCRKCNGTFRGDQVALKRGCCYNELPREDREEGQAEAPRCEFREKSYLWVNRGSDPTKHRHRRYIRVVHDCGSHIGWQGPHQMKHHVEDHVAGVSQPAITRVCRQLRAETLPVFYGQHTFLFTLWDQQRQCSSDAEFNSLLRWLKTIGTRNVAMIKEIKLVYPEKLLATHEVRVMELKGIGFKGKCLAQRISSDTCLCETSWMPTDVDMND